MNILCCSFASESFCEAQNRQKNSFLQSGFKSNQIYLYNQEKLGSDFFDSFPDASEKNKFGWFAFKPFFLISILNKIKKNDILLYLDVNDRPLRGIKDYIYDCFYKHKNLDILVPTTNYPNILFLSKYHKKNFSIELLISSIINFQPEAGALILKNSARTISILNAWYHLTLIQAYEIEKCIGLETNDKLKTRCDQETLFLLSRIYKSIKLESWFYYKLTGKGIRSFIEFEAFRI